MNVLEGSLYPWEEFVSYQFDPISMRRPYCISSWLENPPAPTVPRRGSLAARDSNRSIRLVQLQLGGWHFRQSKLWKSAQDCGNAHFTDRSKIVHMHCFGFDPTWPQHWPRVRVNFGQQGPNFGPTWTNWLRLRPQLGCKMAQFGPNLDPFRNNCGYVASSLKRLFSLVFNFAVFFWLPMTLRLKQHSHSPCYVFPLDPTWCEDVGKGAKLRHLELTWTSVCIRACLGPDFGARCLIQNHANVKPNLRPNVPTLCRVGSS